jgi:hypothetical protein
MIRPATSLFRSPTARRGVAIGVGRAPVHRVDWLDRPPIARAIQALVRAFNAASMYGEPPHVAMLGRSNLQFAAVIPSRPFAAGTILDSYCPGHYERARVGGAFFHDGQRQRRSRAFKAPRAPAVTARSTASTATNSPRRPLGHESQRQWVGRLDGPASGLKPDPLAGGGMPLVPPHIRCRGRNSRPSCPGSCRAPEEKRRWTAPKTRVRLEKKRKAHQGALPNG